MGDAIGGTAGKIMSAVGDIASAFATGGWVGAAIAGVGAVVSGIKSLFGPSKAEKEARAMVKTFEDTVISGLNDGQIAEAAEAALGHWRGNERGAQFVIGVRDAYVAAGHSAAEAEAIVGRYWDAIKHGGPEAVAAIERQMQAVIDEGKKAEAQLQKIAELQSFDSATDQLQQLTSAATFFAVFTDLSTAVERSGSAPGLGPSEWDEQWPTSVSGAASVRRACRVLAEGPI